MAKAFLEITLAVDDANRPGAGAVYSKFKEPFLTGIQGALSKDLLLRDQDVQVLHGFSSEQDAQAYLGSKLFNDDVVVALKPFLRENPDVRIYRVV